MNININIDGRSLRTAARRGMILCTLLLATTVSAVPTTWSADDVLTADDLNGNFEAVDDRIDAAEARLEALEAGNPIAMSGGSGIFTTSSATPVAVPNNQVQLETKGGLVRLELAAAASVPASRLWLIGAAGGADPWLFAYIQFERASSASGPWAPLTTVDFGGVPSAVGSTAVPPGAFANYDDPPAGTWFYRVTSRINPNAGSVTLHVDNVRLVAREVGPAP